jgi:hypothetical protein
MTLPEKIFALRSLPALGGLSDGELAVIAEVAQERLYAPGALVGAAGRPPPRLLFVCRGAVLDDAGRDQGPVPGAAAVLFNRPLATRWTAAPPQGAHCLQIARSHLFTIVRQCPAFVVGLVTGLPPSRQDP